MREFSVSPSAGPVRVGAAAHATEGVGLGCQSGEMIVPTMPSRTTNVTMVTSNQRFCLNGFLCVGGNSIGGLGLVEGEDDSTGSGLSDTDARSDNPVKPERSS